LVVLKRRCLFRSSLLFFASYSQAGQKGTGKWTAINALDMGMPVTLIGEAVFARCLSAIKEERVRASKVLAGPAQEEFTGDKKQFMYVSLIINESLDQS
jgi:6-phosphogluconate dehydrogenase